MISAAFRHITLLEILSLRHNRITGLDFSLINFKLFEKLHNCSFIPELAPRIFYKLRNLKYLDLSGNKLEHIDGGVFQV